MTQIPRAAKGLICPLHKRDMSLVCHKCPLWVLVRGKHPQSEEQIDHWNCSFAFIPMLLIENAQQQRQTGAAVESFRNEMVRINQSPPPNLRVIEATSNKGNGDDTGRAFDQDHRSEGHSDRGIAGPDRQPPRTNHQASGERTRPSDGGNRTGRRQAKQRNR
jgi:hypothetical protein